MRNSAIRVQTEERSGTSTWAALMADQGMPTAAEYYNDGPIQLLGMDQPIS